MPKYIFLDLFTILHISQVCQSDNCKSANSSLRDREDKQLFLKVWLLFDPFVANPPTIRPQVFSAVFFIMYKFELEHFNFKSYIIYKEKNYVFEQICGSFKFAKIRYVKRRSAFAEGPHI